MNYLLRLTSFGNSRHGSPSLRHPLLRRRWFTDEVIIITCVRWYLRFKLSYRDLAELVRELGVSVAPRAQSCAGSYATSPNSKNVGKPMSGRSAIPGVEETYLKVGGPWMYLYRAVDKENKTVESYSVERATSPTPQLWNPLIRPSLG